MLLYSNYIINGSLQQLPKDEHQKKENPRRFSFCTSLPNTAAYFHRNSFLIVFMRARATCSWSAPALDAS